jgi:hypothetical protein
MASCLLGDAVSHKKNCMSYGSKAAARQYIIDGVEGNVPGFVVPDNDEELIFKGWDTLCEKFSQPVFFEKSPQLIHRQDALSLLLQWIKQTDFDVKIIGLVRNPMAVMYSAQKLFKTDPVERQHGWAESCHNLVEFKGNVGSDQFMLVKYEELIMDAAKGFSDVCSFIGVKPNAEMGKDVHARSVDAWKTASEFTLQLEDSVADVAKGYGYSEEELANPGKTPPTTVQKYFHNVSNKARLIKARIVSWYLKPLYLRFFKKR